MALPRLHIGAIDSGVGGLSIIEPLLRHWPSAALTYVCDNGFFPYGTKSEAALLARIERLAVELLLPQKPDVLVVACGTASTLALDLLRSLSNVPVVGVVPALKPAAAVTKSKIIGLLATPGTVSRPYTDDLISRFCQGVDVRKHGADMLVHQAEAYLRGHALDLQALRAELMPIFIEEGNKRTDVVVLGCTHFPLLQAQLESVAPWPVLWLEPGAAIVRRVDSLLGHLLSDGSHSESVLAPPSRQWLLTAADQDLGALAGRLQGLGFNIKVASLA